MSIQTIQIKRGLLAHLPTLKDGELAFTEDTGQLWIGSASGSNTLLFAGGTSAGSAGTTSGTGTTTTSTTTTTTDPGGSSTTSTTTTTTQPGGTSAAGTGTTTGTTTTGTTGGGEATTPPPLVATTITSFSPTADSILTDLTGPFVVTFSGPMNAGTVQKASNWAAVSSVGGGTAIPISLITYDPLAQTATFTFNFTGVPLNALIILAALPAVLDSSGLPVSGNAANAWLYQSAVGTGGGGGVPTFTNTTVAGMKAWYKADAGVTGTTAVTAWADQSASALNLSPYSSHGPALISSAQNSLPALRFSASSLATWQSLDNRTGFASALTAATVVIIHKPANTSTVMAPFQGWDNVNYGILTNKNSKFATGVGESGPLTYLDSSTAAASAPHAVALTWDTVTNQQMTLYVDGAQVGQSSVGQDYATLSNLRIGAGAQTTYSTGQPDTYYYAGDVYEVMVFDHVLSSTDLTTINTYLQAKWLGTSGVSQGTTTVSSYSPANLSTLSAGATAVTANFSAAMGSSAGTAANWIGAASSGSVSIGSVTLGAGSTSAIVSFTATGVPTGATISVVPSQSVLDGSGAFLAGSPCATFTYTAPATTTTAGTGTTGTSGTTTTIAPNSYAYRGVGGGGAYTGYAISAFSTTRMASTDMGNYYRSLDSGVSWYPVSHLQVVTSSDTSSGGINCCSPAFFPDGATIIAWQKDTSQSFPGARISKDNGVTWASMSGLQSLLASGESVRYFKIDALDALTAWAATSAGLYKTADKGVTWRKVTGITADAKGTVIDYGSSGARTIYHATASEIYQSTDNSTFSAWKAVTSLRYFAGGRDGTQLTLAYVDSQSSSANTADTTAVGASSGFSGSYGLVQVSVNGSTTFASAGKGGNHVWMAENDSQTIYVTGGSGTGNTTASGTKVWKSTNAGSTWTLMFYQITPWAGDKMEYLPAGMDIGWFDDTYYFFTGNPRNSSQVGSGGNFFLWTSEDAGAHWLGPQSLFMDATPFIATISGTWTMPAVGSSVTLTIASFSVGSLASIAVNEIVYLGGAGLLQVTAKGTSTVTVKNIANDTPHTPANATSGATIAASARMAPGRMRGMHWNSNGLDNTSVLRMKYHPNNSQLIYCAVSDMAGFVSENNGASFRITSPGRGDSEFINCTYDFAFDSAAHDSGNNTVFAVCGSKHDWPEYGAHALMPPYNFSNSTGATNGGVWKSTDRGVTWTRLTPRTTSGTTQAQDMNHLSIAYDPARTLLMAGTQGNGIFRSDDGGTTWVQFNAGLPTVTTSINATTCAGLIIPQIEWDSSTGDFYCLVAGDDPNFTNSANTGVYYLAQGGASWVKLRTTVTPQAGVTGTLWKYPTSFAIDWNSRAGSLPQTIWLTDTSFGYNAPECGAWVTTNRGGTWTQKLQHSHCRHVCIDPANSSLVYVNGTWQTKGDQGQGGAWSTKNGGTTWTQNASFPTCAIGRATALDPNDSTKIWYTFFGAGMCYGPRP